MCAEQACNRTMKIYISKSDPETLYHLCANAHTPGAYLFSTYKIKNGFVICNLNGKNLCPFRVSPFIFLGFRKNFEEQQQSSILPIRDFVGEIIEMEDRFGDR